MDRLALAAIYAIALMVTTVTCIILAIFLWDRRPARGTPWLALLMLAIAVWSAAYLLEIMNPTIPGKYLFSNITFFSKTTIPVFWFVFALKYAGHERLLTLRNLALLFVIPAVSVVAVWTNDIHGLVWSRIEVAYSNPVDVLIRTHGVLFWLGALYFYAMMLAGAAIIVRAAIMAKVLTTKVITLLIGISLPLVAKAVNIFKPDIIGNLDITPFVFTLCWCLVCWHVFRYRPVDVVPVARDALIDQMTDGIIVVDTSGTVLYHNRAAVAIVNAGKSNLAGMPIAQILPCCNDLPGMVGTHPVIDLGKNGDRRYFAAQVLFLRNRDDMPGGYLISLRDITERRLHLEQLRQYKEHLEELVERRTVALSEVNAQLQAEFAEHKRAEEQLKSQKELIDRILASTPNAVCVAGEKLQILLANPVFCRLFSLSEDEVVGRPITEVFPVADWAERISKVQKGDEPQLKFEFRQRVAEKDRIIVASLLPMQKGEVLLILSDITDERERQERLYFTDRLASVGQMAAGIAHELNNPLTGIIGLSQLLLENGIPDEIKEDLGSIFSEAQRAAGIVRGLLAFSRRQASTKQPVQVNDILEEVLKLRSHDHRIKNIQVVTRFDSTLPEIVADRLQMQQVFMNIILNAEDAVLEARNEGTLTITTAHIGHAVKISFTDNGTGIAPQNLKRIFDPFFTTKEVGKGTGLGLSICYGIVTSHYGRIYAQSEPGKGSTFTVELPVKVHDAADKNNSGGEQCQLKEDTTVKV